MGRSAAIILEIMSSPMTAGMKIAATAAAVVIINRGGNHIMDYSQIVMPEECWMTVVALLIPFGILFGIYTAMRSYTEMLNDKGLTAKEKPYTLNYALGTVVGIILGVSLAFIAAGFIVAYFGIENMPAIAYAVLAVLCALAFVWTFVTIVHRGIETTLKMIKQFAATVTTEAPAVIESVTEATETVNEAIKVTNNKTKLP